MSPSTQSISHYLPTSITRIGTFEVKSETGIIYPIGLTPLQIRLDASKLGFPASKQSMLADLTADAARMFNLLPHFTYKKTKHGIANAHGTMPLYSFDSFGHYSFISKPHLLPSHAIASVFVPPSSPFITECNIVMQLIFYKAILDFIGANTFNQYFATSGIVLEIKLTASNPLLRFRTTLNDNWHSFLKHPTIMPPAFEKGDMVYISNISYYRTRHPVGDSPGINVIYLGKNNDGNHEFGGLFTDKKINHYDQIIDLLVEDYNKIPF